VTARQLGLALVLATACTAVFATRVFTYVDAVRVIAPGMPATPQAGVARIVVEDGRVGALPSPFAVIARIRNNSTSPQTFSLAADAAPLCQVTVGARQLERLDCAQPPAGVDNFSGRHTIDVTSSSGEWSVESLELATYHGRSSGLITAFVLPSALDRHVKPTLRSTILVFLVLTLAFAWPLPRAASATRIERALVRTIAGLIALMFAAVLVLPLVSPYLVVLSTSTFVCWLAALMLARVSCALGRDGRSRLVTRAGPDAKVARWQVAGAGVIVGAVFLSFVVHLVGTRHRNVSGLVQISPAFFDKNPFVRDDASIREGIAFADSGGYDGQFFYHMTFDPWLSAFRHTPERYHEYIDTPPYRYGRIGFSALTKLASANRAEWYPAAMVSIVIAALAACGALLAAVARRHGASPWNGLLVLLVPGYWSSAEMTLPEPLAAAFFLGGYVCLLRKSWALAGALFGASLLVRETAGPMVLGLAAALFLAGSRRESLVVALPAFAPFVMWKLFVGWVFFPDWGWEALTHRPDNFDAPLAGVRQLWSHIASGTYADGLWEAMRAGITFPLLLGAAIALLLAVVFKQPTPIALAALAYAAMAVSMNYRSIWLSVMNAQRLTVDLFLALALVFIALPRTSRALVWTFRGFWAAAALYVFFGTYNALDTLAALVR
jgi:hypothetical protein